MFELRPCRRCSFFDGSALAMADGKVCGKGHRPEFVEPKGNGSEWGYMRVCDGFDPEGSWPGDRHF